MTVHYYIDPAGEPWRTEDAPVNDITRAMDLKFDNYDGEGYELRLRFARKGISNKFYLVGVVESSWDSHDLEVVARSC